jgi:hypothetical protein
LYPPILLIDNLAQAHQHWIDWAGCAVSRRCQALPQFTFSLTVDMWLPVSSRLPGTLGSERWVMSKPHHTLRVLTGI